MTRLFTWGGREGHQPPCICGCKNQPLRYATFKIYISSKNSTIDIWRYFDCRPLSKNFLISEGKNFFTLARTQVVTRRYFASLEESGRSEKSSNLEKWLSLLLSSIAICKKRWIVKIIIYVFSNDTQYVIRISFYTLVP